MRQAQQFIKSNIESVLRSAYGEGVLFGEIDEAVVDDTGKIHLSVKQYMVMEIDIIGFTSEQHKMAKLDLGAKSIYSFLQKVIVDVENGEFTLTNGIINETSTDIFSVHEDYKRFEWIVEPPGYDPRKPEEFKDVYALIMKDAEKQLLNKSEQEMGKYDHIKMHESIEDKLGLPKTKYVAV